MKKRRWLVWFFIVTILIISGLLLWIKLVVNKQPTEHPDPGVPDVELPDLDDPEG